MDLKITGIQLDFSQLLVTKNAMMIVIEMPAALHANNPKASCMHASILSHGEHDVANRNSAYHCIHKF